MATRTAYSDQDLARLYVVLTTNEGNVKRTARDTGFPESTIRRYKTVWAQEGPPKLDDVEQAVVEYADKMEETRDLALQRMHERLEANQGTLPQIATVFGVLTDKIDRARGIGSEQTVHHKHSLPSPDEIRATLVALQKGALTAHQQRDEDIVDAEFTEQPAALLPPRTR